MLMVCQNKDNRKDCFLCMSNYHCESCYNWHVESKECNKNMVKNLLGPDIHG